MVLDGASDWKIAPEPDCLPACSRHSWPSKANTRRELPGTATWNSSLKVVRGSHTIQDMWRKSGILGPMILFVSLFYLILHLGGLRGSV